MKLGEVLKKERTMAGLSEAEVAEALRLAESDYVAMERGDADIERWGPLLAELAIVLETPTSRLLAHSGRAEDVSEGQCGERIRKRREGRGLSAQELAEQLGLTPAAYGEIESGQSPLETRGRQFLRFAELVDQPVFNLFYPCGVKFSELSDYP